MRPTHLVVMRPTLTFDIETVVRPGCPPDSFAPSHLIPVCLGMLFCDTAGKRSLHAFSGASVPLVFASTLKKHNPRLVTYNGRKFDVPVLVAACFEAGLQLPLYYNDRNARYRFSDESHLDLCDQLVDFGAGRMGSMDSYAKLIGWPGKVGTSGSDVAILHQRGDTEAIENYCLCDVMQTAALAVRWALLTGRTTPGDHNADMSVLMTLVDTDVRLEALVGKIDEGKALVRE